MQEIAVFTPKKDEISKLYDDPRTRFYAPYSTIDSPSATHIIFHDWIPKSDYLEYIREQFADRDVDIMYTVGRGLEGALHAI